MAKYQHRAVIDARRAHISPYSNVSPGAAPKPEEVKLNFSEIFDALRQGKWVILLTSILVTSAIAVYTFTVTPVYETGTVVRVETRMRTAPGLGSTAASAEQRDLWQEVGVLQQSMDLAERVAEGLLTAASASGDEAAYPILTGTDGTRLDESQIALRLGRQVRFIPDMTQGVINIYSESSSPKEAAELANLYASEYEKYSVRVSRESIVAKKKFVEDQVAKFRNELLEVQNQWAAFAQGKQVYTLGVEGERLVDEVAILRTSRSEAQLELEQAENTLRLLQQRVQTLEAAIPSVAERVTLDRRTSELESRISQMDQTIAELELQAEQYYVVNPSLRGNESADKDLADIIRRVDHFKNQRKQLTDQYIAETAKLPQNSGQSDGLTEVADLRTRIAESTLAVQELRQRVNLFDAKIAAYDSRLAGLPRQAIELEQLERDKARVEGLYNTFSTQLTEIQIAEEAEIGYAKIMRQAPVPFFPVKPNKKQNLVLGLMLGLGLGMGLAFVKSTMNKQLRNPDDLQEKGYSLLGIIPPMDKDLKAKYKDQEAVEVEGHSVSTRLVAMHDPWSPIAENFRLLRTRIQVGRPGKPVQVLLVSSPEMGDGKTVTTVNLAVAMAQSGRRTLLIDADLRRPAVHKMFGLSNREGLAGVLDGTVSLEEATEVTMVDNLSVLTAGAPTVPAAELLGSVEMAGLLEVLRSEYDTIVLDSPPVLAVTDAVVLAMNCDATIIVTSAEKTDLRALESTKKILDAVGAPVAGTVLNRYEAKGSSAYSYGYGEYSYAGKPVA